MDINENNEDLEKGLSDIINNLHKLIESRYEGVEEETLLIMKNDLNEKFMRFIALSDQEGVDADIVRNVGVEIELSIQLIEDYLEAITF